MLRTGLGIIIKLTLAFFTIMTGNSFLPNDGDNSMQEWVKENAMDINECNYYPYVVIEPVQEGIYMHPRTEHWYKFDREKDRYEPCEKPDRFKQVIGWSLG